MHACKAHIPSSACICLVGQQAAVRQQQQQVRLVMHGRRVTAGRAPEALQAKFGNSWQLDGIVARRCTQMQHTVSSYRAARQMALAAGVLSFLSWRDDATS